jgi:hypothetical protein
VPIVTSLVGLLDSSTDRVEVDLFGCFSPRGRPCMPELPATPTVSMNEATIEIVAPVL